MGGGSSKYLFDMHKKSDAEIMRFMLPLYYTSDTVTNEDIELARTSWNLIINDASTRYKELSSRRIVSQPSSISWFYTTFYNRLFDIHPACKPLFNRGIVGQGNFLVKMITLTLNQLRNPDTFRGTMESLAARHCDWGVRGVEYGIVGDVLFYSLHYVLGDEGFNEGVQVAWWRIYSAMLTHILPICIRHERDAPAPSDISNARQPVVHSSRHDPKSTCFSVITSSSAGHDNFMIVEDA